VVDGRRYPTLRSEEFVLTVTEYSRVVIELSGLVLGSLPPRTFVLSLVDLTEPFLLFDEHTRKQRRSSGSLPAGRYWLLHRATDILLDAEQRYEWVDEERALSLVHIHPGREVVLQSISGEKWRFVATLTPFFDL